MNATETKALIDQYRDLDLQEENLKERLANIREQKRRIQLTMVGAGLTQLPVSFCDFLSRQNPALN